MRMTAEQLEATRVELREKIAWAIYFKTGEKTPTTTLDAIVDVVMPQPEASDCGACGGSGEIRITTGISIRCEGCEGTGTRA